MLTAVFALSLVSLLLMVLFFVTLNLFGAKCKELAKSEEEVLRQAGVIVDLREDNKRLRREAAERN